MGLIIQRSFVSLANLGEKVVLPISHDILGATRTLALHDTRIAATTATAAGTAATTATTTAPCSVKLKRRIVLQFLFIITATTVVLDALRLQRRAARNRNKKKKKKKHTDRKSVV